MNREVKPCPFCGNYPHVIEGNKGDYIDGAIIYCKCEVFAQIVNTSKDKAIEIWNARPIEDALQSRIRELEGNIEAYEHDLPLLKAAERIAELKGIALANEILLKDTESMMNDLLKPEC